LKAVFRIRVQQPVEFLKAVLARFTVDAYLSLEGDLSHLSCGLLTPIATEPNSVLRRNTIWPKEDFAIFAVTDETREPLTRSLLPQVGVRSHVMHVQLASAGQLVCGAYDQFDESCVWVDSSFGEQALRALHNAHVIDSYELVEQT
jgi:hypothetical protein